MLKMKHLNALRHATKTSRGRLEELKLQYQRLKPEGARSPSTDSAAEHTDDNARVDKRTLPKRWTHDQSLAGLTGTLGSTSCKLDF